jgi:PAS domain-containing protein
VAIALTNARLYTQVPATQNRLNKFLNAIPLNISVHDAKGQIIYTNQVAQHLLNIQDLAKADRKPITSGRHRGDVSSGTATLGAIAWR